ncbi:hypothetical protein CH253_08115 [Rhodococcus sp. 06-156-3C]|nr:hypothetical protein CH253_08115 [Rhodococcus sp. 06-156-3C]
MIYRAVLGTALPADASTVLAAAYKDLGGVSDAGITNSQSREVQKIKDYGGETVATPQSDYSETFQVELIEATNLEVLKTVYGDGNVEFKPATATKGAQITVLHNAEVLPQSVYVVDTMHGKGIKRQVVPIGQITNVGDVVQLSSDVIKYALTIEAFKYVDNGKAKYVIDHIDLGIPTAGGGS